MNEMNIFEILKEPYHLPKQPKLFEAFSGIGCQRMAFNRLGIKVDMVGFSEIDKYAIKSYNAIHGETKNFGSIVDIKGNELPEIDVFTWSFPCTDLSKAGKQKGMTKETRSGLAFEVMRILWEAKEANTLPKVLIMENVIDLIQSKFIRQFQDLQLELEQIGYTNYVETMNAKNYGVAQNRDRVFMVSILGDYYYEFPKPFPLEKKLKDYLESNVSENYYLTDKMLTYFQDMTDRNGFIRGGRFRPRDENDEYAWTITTRYGSVASETYIKIPEATAKGYKEAYDGDGVYLNRPHQKRGVVQDKMIQTLKANNSDVGVVDNMRIRKLTPLEVWRLMGIDDKDFEKAKQVNSNAQLYKQAGNGIVVDVFAQIINNLV